MKTLEIHKIWTGDGFAGNPVHLIQVARTETTAIYERRSNKGERHDGYEVIIIKKRLKGQPLPGGMFEEEDREVYPSANQFGKLGWHIRGLKTAMEKYNQLSIPKEKSETVMVVPVKEFTTNELAEENDVEYIEASNFIKHGIESGTIRFVREERRNAKGKPSKVFEGVGVPA